MEQGLTSADGRFVQGSTLLNPSLNSNGATYAYDNANYEAGYWYQAVSVAAGDIVKFWSIVSVPEYQLSFSTPPALGGYSPVNTCLLAQRGVGYRPSA